MKNLWYSITKSEWKFVTIMIVIILIVTGAPYLYGYFSAEPGMIYNGLHALSPGDIPIYYSYINQIKEGQIAVFDLFTGEHQSIGTINVWWLLVGLVAKFLNISVMLVFQLSRLFMVPVFIITAYLFISYVLKSPAMRKTGLFFLLFSSGLGFYSAAHINGVDLSGTASYWWPIDLWLTEAITFNALYQTSHFIASITLMIAIFLLMLLAFENKKISYVIYSGLMAAFYINFHPYYLPVILGALGLYVFIKILQAKKILWREVGYMSLLTLFSVSSAWYHIWLIGKSPEIALRAMRNVTVISPLPFVIMGYGILCVGFILGLYFLIKNKKLNDRFVFLLSWLVVNIVLIYSPFQFHSRYTQGIHVVLVLFTVIGLFYSRDFLKQKLKPKRFDFWVNNPALLGVLFLLLFGMSNVYSVFRDIYFFTIKPGEIEVELYLPQDVISSIDWLETQDKTGSILAADVPSKFIPGFSGQSVFVAHAHETLFFYSKAVKMLWFFADDKHDEAKEKFLLDNNISYILHSDYEKTLGTYTPADKSYLELVFDSPNAKVYMVTQ